MRENFCVIGAERAAVQNVQKLLQITEVLLDNGIQMVKNARNMSENQSYDRNDIFRTLIIIVLKAYLKT